jgi:ABC-type sulfate/molybdate transport systems ATPase subunit
MLELALKAQRGPLSIDFKFWLTSPWTVIFGPSGSGKSSILRIIAGLDQAREAHIAFDGRTLTDTAQGVQLRPGQRQLAMVTQSPALFPHLNVAENIAYGLSHLPRPEREERVHEMLELVGGAHLETRQIRKLSGGEGQRVALARALAPHPKLLLLDEPFSALDGQSSDEMLTRLIEWLKTHSTQTILVTHDATDAFTVSAEVILLNEGKVVNYGAPQHVLAVERERLLHAVSSYPQFGV